MLKRKQNCKVCQAIGKNRNITERIYQSSHFNRMGESLTKLVEDLNAQGYEMSYQSMINHCKKHQYLSEKDFNERHLRQIAKTAERKIMQKKLESIDVWDEVIDEGMDRLKNGEMKLSAQDLLRAAKDKSDMQFKKQDQELKLAEMVFFFASGENKQELSKPYDRRIIEGETRTDLDTTAGAAADLGGWTDESSAVHYPPSWDAST